MVWEDGKLFSRRRATDIVYLNSNKAFNTISHRFFLDRMSMYRLDEKAMRWTEKQIKAQVRNMEISGTRRIWRSVNSSVPQVSI